MIQATKAALADAGPHRATTSTASRRSAPSRSSTRGCSASSPVNWWASGMMAPAFSYSAMQAIAAVSSGFCHTALALRVIKQQPSASALGQGARRATTR